MKRFVGLGLCALLVGCVDDGDPAPEPVPVVLPDTGPGDGAVVDLAPPDMADAEPDPEPITPSTADWCAAVVATRPAEAPAAVQWSAAHALARFFGVHAGSVAVDDALTAAMESPDARTQVAAYADALPFVCALAGDGGELGPARVELVDGVAWVEPGIGELVVPEDARAVVLDLRGLDHGPDVEPALRRAAEAILAESIARRVETRVVAGMPDEVFSPQSPYRASVSAIDLEPWPGDASPRPVAVLVDETPPPAAAELALAIRLTGAGWLVGASVFSAVAESMAIPVGDAGLLVRWGTRLAADGTPWPDVVAPDARTIEALLDRLDDAPGPPNATGAERERTGEIAPFGQVPTAPSGPAARRAMLIAAHGALRWFFPYFDVVDDVIDERLLETLATLDDDGPWDRADTRALLRRFAEAIADGHAFVFDGRASEGQMAPIAVDHLEDESAVVRRSGVIFVRAGEVITAIDGRPAAEWYADEVRRTSASSRGYALDLASRRYLRGPDPLSLTLRTLEGESRDVMLDRVGFDAVPSTTPWLHPTGFLEAFDAPGVLYVNMAGDVEGDTADLMARLDRDLPAAEALIVDMRGYPGTDHYQVTTRIIGGAAFRSPIFEVPTWSGPLSVEDVRDQYVGGNGGIPPFAGPVVLLVGPTSVSAAENFSMMIAPFEQVTVVGRSSAATNGNITGLWLPGGLGLTFTGMAVYFPDGSPFHGIGIVPDVEVWPTAESLATGVDRELDAALDLVLEP